MKRLMLIIGLLLAAQGLFAANECTLQYRRSDNGLAPPGIVFGSLGTETIRLDSGEAKSFNIDHDHERDRNAGGTFFGSHLRSARNVGTNSITIKIKGPFGTREHTFLSGEDAIFQDDLMSVRCQDRFATCFGAGGANCGKEPGETSSCQGGGHCLVNGGSIEHDTCCWANPRGAGCRNGLADFIPDSVVIPGGHDGRCVAEFRKAIEETSNGLSWYRDVDSDRKDRDGRVDMPEYCAPAGTIVHRTDSKYCCANSFRPVNLRSSRDRRQIKSQRIKFLNQQLGAHVEDLTDDRDPTEIQLNAAFSMLIRESVVCN
jgi:hypothetical protein